jgi:hypothetical protein
MPLDSAPGLITSRTYWRPALSNNTFDARWIALLSWCLRWSHVAWSNAGGGDLSRRDDQRARYAWLRPLELLWIARTLKAEQNTGQLRGKLSIKRWFKANEQSPNFAMSPDQFRRYRQVGMYGAYRVVFRTIEGLTTGGDGWTLTDNALKLADIVNDSLPRAVRLKQEHFEKGMKWGHWSGGGEARYWSERGWPSWAAAGGYLPTPADASAKKLQENELKLIKPLLFGDDSTRRLTAEVLASAKNATSHADLCDALANSKRLAKKLEHEPLALLPAFTRFADAAIHAMRGLWNEINRDDVKQAPTVKQLASSSELQARFQQLKEAGSAWLKAPDRSAFPHEPVVTRLAEAMRDAATPLEQLRALARHHHDHGGGRRWFREQAGKLVPLVADTGITVSDYRFRLRTLCRLAAQCDVADMRSSLTILEDQESDDDEEVAL